MPNENNREDKDLKIKLNKKTSEEEDRVDIQKEVFKQDVIHICISLLKFILIIGIASILLITPLRLFTGAYTELKELGGEVESLSQLKPAGVKIVVAFLIMIIPLAIEKIIEKKEG